MTQEVEHLPSKHKVLSSSLSTAKRRKGEREERQRQRKERKRAHNRTMRNIFKQAKVEKFSKETKVQRSKSKSTQM
jgi:hypothetical protein